MKTALVTGATAGIGAATARAFVHDGWRVVATGRRRERLDALREELGEGLYPLLFDISDDAAVAAALGTLPEAWGGIDLLVNNAGLALGTKIAAECTLADWQTMVATNIGGVLSVTHRLLPTLIERRGAIINLASVAGTYPYTGGNVYGASKAFLQQLSLNLRSDLHGTGVRVSAIDPGMVETEFTMVRTGGDKEASDKLYAGAHPMSAEDIANVVLWMANLPSHLNINRLELMPVTQSFAGFQVSREG